VHVVTFALDQVSVDLPPFVIAVGLADNETVGAGEPVTRTVAVAGVGEVPPAPVQERLYVVVAVGDTDSVPLVASAPVQPPEAVHVVAFVLDQVSVDFPPAAIDAGLALRVTVGAGIATRVTVVEAWPVPPAPVQERLYVVVAVGDTESVPLVASAPVQPPEAVHAVAFVLDQVRVELPPAAIDAGLAPSVTVGAPVDAVTVNESGGNTAVVGLSKPIFCAPTMASEGTVTWTVESLMTTSGASCAAPIQAELNPVKPAPVTVMTVPIGPETGANP